MKLTVVPGAFVPETAALTEKSRSEGVQGFVDDLYREVEGFYKILEGLNDLDDVAKFENISGMSARASHLRNQLTRAGTQKDARLDYARINYIDPFLREVDRQFKIHSRVFSVAESEQRMLG